MSPSLCYCTNIHPGESWDEVEAQLHRHLPAVKARAFPDAPMGVGLRLSAAAALTLEQAERLAAFRRFLDRHDLAVVTLNGFPWGAFHGGRVKEAVYRPDWRDPRRLDYTLRLARLLAALLPPGATGCVSSVPVGWRHDFRGAEDIDRAVGMLARCAEELDRLDRPIILALEPEPGCVLETTSEAVTFVAGRLPGGRVGLCLDACHAAVEFEHPAETVRLPRAAGVPIGKVQVSAGIEAPATAEAAARLADFAEDVWLHQVVEADDSGGLRHFDDLPQALAAPWRGTRRVHFHVPVWAERFGALRGTQDFLRGLLPLVRDETLEIETYTWSVLPPDMRGGDIDEDIAREIRWVRDRLA